LIPFPPEAPVKEILEVADYEPEVYPESAYKVLGYRQQAFTDVVHRLRRNVLGRNRVYLAGRMCLWRVRKEEVWREVTVEEIEGEEFGEVERGKLVDTVDGFIRNNSYTQFFVDVVTDDVASDYLNYVAVEMNLYTIRDFLENGHYRSKQMLFYDLQLIEKNSVTFNGEDNEITRDAKRTNENLRKIFEKVLIYKLRSVSSNGNIIQVPQRNVNARNRESSIISDHSLPQGSKKSTPQKPKRSTRKRNEVNYNEESKLNQMFKKPTPQKMKRQEDLSPEPEEVDFKIDLEPDKLLRRSLRSRNRVGYSGKPDYVFEEENKMLNLELEEAKTPERRVTRGNKKRETKMQRKSEFGQKRSIRYG
jgi:hypothetical protein